jgi:hypothetical protein
LAADPAFTGDDDLLIDAARNIPDFPGQYSIIMHCTTDGRKLAKQVGKGSTATWVEVKVKDVADYLKNNGIVTPIRLIACASGMLGDQSPAQQLANLLGLPVLAPAQVIIITALGTISPAHAWPWFLPTAAQSSP